MAGSLAMTIHNEQPYTATAIATRDQWQQIHYSRYFAIPKNSISATYPSLIPLQPRRKHGSWISTSSPDASIHIIYGSSTSDAILSVYFREKRLEEHYISKLQFSWPQVACLSGYPARGSRTLFVSYQDSLGEIQKFALRFSTNYEAESFINVLQETLKDEEPEPLYSDFHSDISSRSEFMSSSILPFRATGKEMDIVASVDTYTPEMPPSLNYEVEQPSSKQENVTHVYEPTLPPSFTSLVANCYSQGKEVKNDTAAAQPNVSEEADIKSLILRYMEDSAFQEMMVKVEKVIDELGGDLSL